jgi:hypothetical protein
VKLCASAFLCFALLCPPAWAADWAELHTAANATGSTGTSRAVTITSSTAGSVLGVGAVCGVASGTAPTVSTVADNINASTSYSKLVSINDTTSHFDVEVWVALTPTSGATTITVTMSAACGNFLDAFVTEFTPPTSTTLSLETGTGTGINTASGNSTSCATGSITPVGTDDLVIALCGAPSVTAVSNSYNLRSTGDGNGWTDKFPISGATSTTMTTGTGRWDAVIGAIKAVASGGAAAGFNKRKKLENLIGI